MRFYRTNYHTHKLPHTQPRRHFILLHIAKMGNTIEKVGGKTYKFDFYNFNGTNYLRISRVSGKKEYVVKVYTGNLNGKKEEFLKIATIRA